MVNLSCGGLGGSCKELEPVVLALNKALDACFPAGCGVRVMAGGWWTSWELQGGGLYG